MGPAVVASPPKRPLSAGPSRPVAPTIPATDQSVTGPVEAVGIEADDQATAAPIHPGADNNHSGADNEQPRSVQRFGGGLLDGIRSGVGSLTSGLTSGWSSLRSRASGVFSQVRSAAGAAVNRVRELGAQVANGVQQAWGAARGAISTATSRFQSFVGSALSALSGPVAAMRRAVESMDVSSLRTTVGRLLTIVNGVGGRVASAGQAVTRAVGSAWSEVSSTASAAGQRVSSAAGAAFAGVRSVAGSLTSRLGSAWTGLSSRAQQIGGFASQAAGFDAGVVGRLIGGARSIWGGCESAWAGLSSRFAPAAASAGELVTGAGSLASRTVSGATELARRGWDRVKAGAEGLVGRVSSGVGGIISRIRSVPWAGALTRAAEVVPAVRKVESLVRAPDAAMAPHVRAAAQQVHAELPGQSRAVLTRHLSQQGVAASAAPGPVVQRQEVENRTTESPGPLLSGLWHVLTEKLTGVTFGFVFNALTQLIKDLFWPIPVVEAEMRGLWSDLGAFAGQFFIPRNPLRDPAGSLHDVWSNLMTVVDLPILLVRRLSTMGLALMGWVTVLLMLAGAFFGTGAGTIVGGVASALASLGLATPAGAVGGGVGGGAAGAGAGFGTAMALGEGVVIAFAAAHVAEVVKSLLDLLTVRQTAQEKADDYNQTVDSAIALAVVAILVAVGWAGAKLAARIAPLLARVMPPRLAAAIAEFSRHAGRQRNQPPPERTPPAQDSNRTPTPTEQEPAPRPVETEPASLAGWRLKLQLLQGRVARLRQQFTQSGSADPVIADELTRLEASVENMARRLDGASTPEGLTGFGRELRVAEGTAYDLEARVAELGPGGAPTPVQQQLADSLGMDARTIAGYLTDAQAQQILDLMAQRVIRGDRLAGLRNLVQDYAARGRAPVKLMELIETTEWPDLRQIFDDRAQVNWEPNWRGRANIEDGNAAEGWAHIDARHVTGNAPEGAGDLFAPGTTRGQVQAAAQQVVDSGTRVSRPETRIQTFEGRASVNGQTDVVRVIVDASDGRVITVFPVRGG